MSSIDYPRIPSGRSVFRRRGRGLKPHPRRRRGGASVADVVCTGPGASLFGCRCFRARLSGSQEVRNLVTFRRLPGFPTCICGRVGISNTDPPGESRILTCFCQKVGIPDIRAPRPAVAYSPGTEPRLPIPKHLNLELPSLPQTPHRHKHANVVILTVCSKDMPPPAPIRAQC